jgi:transcriptional regulator with XRE-family HTH domain
MDVRARIGWNLKRLREERGITQEDFATDCRLDRGYVSGVERGVRNPAVNSLVKMVTVLGVDIAELFDAAKAEEFSATYRPRRGRRKRER